ncbi:MAG: hypothetical protein OXT67_01670 [Zetaproteobacteria bacterium]|nr:hypothetical protein [Zetaproteobacteria bacterium]
MRVWQQMILVVMVSNMPWVAQAQEGWTSPWERWSGKTLPYVESVTPQRQYDILQQLLYPSYVQAPLSSAVVGLLTQHAAVSRNTQMVLPKTIQGYAEMLHSPFGLKDYVETRKTVENLRMGPRTSFYFYLSLLVLMRDVDETPLEELPFDLKQPLDLNKAVRKWSINCGKPTRTRTPESETIAGDILTHRAAYFELLAYRFFQKNRRLDGWGKYYQYDDRTDYAELGTTQDSWKRVRVELEEFERVYPACDFATRVAKITGASVAKVRALLPKGVAPGS